jgi:hypothetical protein
MSAVSRRASTNDGVVMIRPRNATFVRTPTMRYPASAARIRSIACARVGPCTMSFAIIGS